MPVKQYVYDETDPEDLRIGVLRKMHLQKHRDNVNNTHCQHEMQILRDKIDALKKQILHLRRKDFSIRRSCSEKINQLLSTIDNFENLGLEEETLKAEIKLLKAEIHRFKTIRRKLENN
jgi:predicted  nucleic acid-binding Zn-ribbon protein